MSAAATLYQPFTWLSEAQRQAPHAPLLDLLCKARDVAAGAAEVTAILERIGIDAECGDEDGEPLPPLLDEATCGHLRRMVVAGLGLLVDRLDEAIQRDMRQCDRAAGRAGLERFVPENPCAGLERFVPENPCAGMMLNAEEAAGLAALRGHLQAVGGAA